MIGSFFSRNAKLGFLVILLLLGSGLLAQPFSATGDDESEREPLESPSQQDGEMANEVFDPAQDNPGVGLPEIHLDQISVTGLRSTRRLGDVPILTEILGQEEIKNSSATSLRDVLEDYGLMHTQNAMGDYITLQGLGQGRVLFLIDGRRVPGRVARRLNASSLPLGDIDRIEIIRGAQSALFGSDGMGGVINIITRRPQEEFSARVEAWNSVVPAYVAEGGGLLENWNDVDPLHQQGLSGQLGFAIGDWSQNLVIDYSRNSLYLDGTGEYSVLPESQLGKISWDHGFALNEMGALRTGVSYSLHRLDRQTSVDGSLSRQDINRWELFWSSEHYLDNGFGLTTKAYNHPGIGPPIRV